MRWKNAEATSSPASATPPGGPPVQVTRSEGNDNPFSRSDKLYITSNIDNRSLSLAVSEQGLMGRALTVQMEIVEKVEGKGSVKLTFAVVTDQAVGATYMIGSKFSGAVEVEKLRVSSPPLPDTEFVIYNFGVLRSPSFLIVEKKTNGEFVEMITAAHCLRISEDAFYYVVIKIAVNNRSEGLCVEVDGPVIKTAAFVGNLVEKFLGKLGRRLIQGILGGSGDKNMKQLNQSEGSYVNAGMQSLKGFTNSSGFMTGFGNGASFLNCRISHLNK